MGVIIFKVLRIKEEVQNFEKIIQMKILLWERSSLFAILNYFHNFFDIFKPYVYNLIYAVN